MKQPLFSVVIPVYKNTEMVIRNLKHNKPFFKNCEVILVDDASGNDMVPQLKEHFPEMTIIENKVNKGFGPTVNAGVRVATADYLILLGSDVRLKEPFSATSIKEFETHPDLFALSFMQKERDGSSIGKNTLFFKKGMPHHRKIDDLHAGENAWADGGSSIVRKSMYEKLGGFNELFAPFYWEDIDLSYRAYSRGWYVMFDPKLFVEHHHESTIGSLFTKKHITTIAYRNHLLFTWLNITCLSLWIQHLMYLPYHLMLFVIRGECAFLNGFLKAFLLIPRVVRYRLDKQAYEVVIDTAIFDRFTA